MFNDFNQTTQATTPTPVGDFARLFVEIEN